MSCFVTLENPFAKPRMTVGTRNDQTGANLRPLGRIA
jgi:hypothetical protein